MKTLLRLLTAMALLAACQPTFAAPANDGMHIVLPSLPQPLALENHPLDVRAEADGSLVMRAPGQTNLFNYPTKPEWSMHNAPMALFTPEGDFTFSARLSAPLKNVYDVAALVVYENENYWAKFCYENSADKVATVVSVVTSGFSDDCNSELITTPYIYYAIARKGTEYSFHFSTDGKTWKLVRHFAKATSTPVRIGFAVHAYCDEPLTGTFSEITYKTSAPANMRSLEPCGK
jgi:regulation of enolase protein 1 (concanavalin A-like superfamily)